MKYVIVCEPNESAKKHGLRRTYLTKGYGWHPSITPRVVFHGERAAEYMVEALKIDSSLYSAPEMIELPPPRVPLAVVIVAIACAVASVIASIAVLAQCCAR